jgi:hypothetical protein
MLKKRFTSAFSLLDMLTVRLTLLSKPVVPKWEKSKEQTPNIKTKDYEFRIK